MPKNRNCTKLKIKIYGHVALIFNEFSLALDLTNSISNDKIIG